MQNTLHLPVFSIPFENSKQENILQTHLIQYTALVIDLWSVKYTTVTVVYAKRESERERELEICINIAKWRI